MINGQDQPARRSWEELATELDQMQRHAEELEECRRNYLQFRRRYEELLESAPDAMLYVDQGGKIILCNSSLEKLFGYGLEELKGKDVEVLIPERLRAGHSLHLAEYFRSPRKRAMGTGLEIYGLKRDGTEFPADISLSPILTDGDLLTIAAVRDISDQKRVEEQIERNYLLQQVISSVLKISLEPVPLDQQLERVLDLILSIPGLALNSKGAIYLVEDEPDVLILKTFRNSEPGPPPCERVIFGKCLCGRAASSCETVFAHCIDGRHEILFRSDEAHGHYCIPIISGGKSLGVITIILKEGHRRLEEEEAFLTAVADTLAGVLERYRSDLHRQRLTNKLAETDKFSALGRLVSNIADEMRNPLVATGGFARRLYKKLPDGVPEKEYAEYILSEVNKLEQILKNVLTLSLREGLRLERQDIHSIIEEALRFFDTKLRDQSIRIERSYGEVPEVNVDRLDVGTAIEHLIANALEAMPSGGTLSLITGRTPFEGRLYGFVKIKDTGKGIEKEKQQMVFEPFFTTKISSHKGAGLGLSIAKKIAEDHGGFVEIENDPGRSFAAALHFPLKQPEK